MMYLIEMVYLFLGFGLSVGDGDRRVNMINLPEGKAERIGIFYSRVKILLQNC